MVHSIEVAEAAAIINVALIIVQFTYPLLITLVAVGILKKTTNAATWSVFGQLIQRSKWPFLLRTDTASGFKVDKRIRMMTILSTGAGLLLAVAAAMTPLGLHSTIKSSETSDVPFSYIKDNSAIGQATQSHTTYVANRLCGDSLFEDCPGNDSGFEAWSNSTGFGLRPKPGVQSPSLSTSIASNISNIFTSDTNTKKSTVAGIFDIQYRSFINYNNQTKPRVDENAQWLDEGKPRTQGQFRYYQQFLLENRTSAIEGLIVAVEGMPGIGFRNHTLPPSSTYGYTWEEDILWMEPETACTDLNITYDYTMPAPLDFNSLPNARLTDRGGFVNLVHDYPYLDLNDTQSNPQLQARSWKAAVLTNNFLIKYMNESRTDFRMGKEYLIRNYTTYTGSLDPTPNKIEFSQFGNADLNLGVWTPSLPGVLSNLRTDTANISSKKLVESDGEFYLDTVIQGYGGLDTLNISKAGAGGGLVLGIGQMVDATGKPLPSGNYRMDPGTNWSQPLYACVSSIKASVKRVSFQVNGTASISNLVIKDITPKEYSDGTMPTWGMENTGREVQDLAPLWGLVSEESSKLPGLSVVRKPEFYLPASSSSLYGIMTGEDAVAGARAPLGAFGSIYTSDGAVDSPDYSGATNYLLYTKWKALSAQVGSAGQIVDYIWTDLMANALVSSKSALSGKPATNSSTPALQRRDTTDNSESVTMPATRCTVGITYDWKYAIPALLFLLMYAGLFAWSLLMFCTRGLNFGILRFVLDQTSAGRAMTTERYGASSDADFAKTFVWASVRGEEVVRVGKHDAQRTPLISSPQGYHPVDTKTGAQESTTHLS